MIKHIPDTSLETMKPSKVMKIKLVDLNDYIEKFKKAFKLAEGIRIPILDSFYYNAGDLDIYFKKGNLDLEVELPSLFKDMESKKIEKDNLYYLKSSYFDKVSLIDLSKVYLQDNYYIFESSDGSFLHADIGEFNKKGIMSKSLKSGKPQLPGVSHLVSDYVIEVGNIGIKLIKDNNVVTTIPGDLATIVDKDKGQLLIVNKNKFELTTISKDGKYTQETPIFYPYGEITKINIDNHKNFVFVIGKHGEEYKMHILNRKTLQEIDHIDDIKDIVLIDNRNNINLLRKDHTLVYLNTNFDQFKKGYVDGGTVLGEFQQKIVKIEDKGISDLKKALSSGLDINTDILKNGEEGVDEQSMDDSEIRKQIRELNFSEFEDKTLNQLYKEANDPKKIDIVRGIIQQIKRKPEIMAVKGILDPIESKIIQKRNEIKLNDIFGQIDDLSQFIKNFDDDFANLIAVKTKLGNLKIMRSQIAIPPTDKDKEFKELIKLTDKKIEDYQEKHREDLVADIEDNLVKIEEYLGDIDYLIGITSVYNTDIWKQTENMVGYLEKDSKKEFKDKMKNLVRKKQQKLTNDERGKHKVEQQEIEENVQELKDSLNQIKAIVGSVNDENALNNIELSDPLVLDIKQKLDDLPANKGQEILLKLNNIFKERLLSVQFNKEENQGSIKSLDQYGIPKSLYFVPDVMKKVKWNIFGKPNKNGKFKLLFQSSVGNEIEPSINKKILGKFDFTYNFEERQDLKIAIGSWKNNGKKKYFDLRNKLSELKKEDNYKENDEYKKLFKEFEKLDKQYYVAKMLGVMDKMSNNGMRNISPRPNLPSIDNKTVIGETIKQSLGKRARLLDQQQQYKQGIMIVESEAGTGKNFKVDILGYLTNREVFDISCNEYMEKEDLLFSPEINEEGTFRTPSNLVKGLQTPGSVIVLDEINTLKPGVSKLLNPLLDNRRYINDPQLGRIHAHSSVVIIGLMNPRYYRGTQDLPQEFISRGRFTDDQYPGSMEEAYMNSKYLNNVVGKLTQIEFESYREKYIDLGEVPNDKKIYNNFVALEKVTLVANKIRDLYSKTMRNKVGYDEELDFVFTIRDGNYVLQDFNHTQDIKKSLEDVILPKIAEHKHKEVAQRIIDEACDD